MNYKKRRKRILKVVESVCGVRGDMKYTVDIFNKENETHFREHFHLGGVVPRYNHSNINFSPVLKPLHPIIITGVVFVLIKILPSYVHLLLNLALTKPPAHEIESANSIRLKTCLSAAPQEPSPSPPQPNINTATFFFFFCLTTLLTSAP